MLPSVCCLQLKWLNEDNLRNLLGVNEHHYVYLELKNTTYGVY